MIYGYCRVSTKSQSITRQIRNIQSVYPDAKIYQEKFSGKRLDRLHELNKLLRKVKKGDTIIFDSVSRMSRNADEGSKLYFELYGKGVELQFIKEPSINTAVFREAAARQIEIQTSTGDAAIDSFVGTIIDAMNQLLRDLAESQIRAAFAAAQAERDTLSERTKEGMQTAREAGKQIGQPKESVYHVKKSDAAKAKIRQHSKKFDGTLNDTDTMKVCGISRNTYYKYVRQMLDEERKNKDEI